MYYKANSKIGASPLPRAISYVQRLTNNILYISYSSRWFRDSGSGYGGQVIPLKLKLIARNQGKQKQPVLIIVIGGHSMQYSFKKL